MLPEEFIFYTSVLEKQNAGIGRTILPDEIIYLVRSLPNKKRSLAVLILTCQHGQLTSDMFLLNYNILVISEMTTRWQY